MDDTERHATVGYAVVSAPGKGEVVPSGGAYTIKWSAGSFTGLATISLMGGNDPTTLEILSPLAQGIPVENEKFAWAVDCSLGAKKTYGLKIADEATSGEVFQYSFPFQIKGPSCGASSSSSAVSSATATGYPTKGSSVTSSATAPSYPVETSSSFSSSSVHSNSTTSAVHSSSSTTVKSSTHVVPTSTLATVTTPVVTVTSTNFPTKTSASSGVPASSTSTTPIPTAGATRAGAGLALGLMAAVLAL
ncbi:hypothetical protein NUW58_g1323 [Xylaria curta]|uniref:Uncharacterized protein n=1 Tax=Xylaria curta TaxID=42375 RepID=A0ACC1PL92_9PEZI|nr:hypothetical protein NUW58_g1323 [Xylaria curta]